MVTKLSSRLNSVNSELTSGNGSGNKSLLAGKHANEKHAEVKRQNQTQEDIEGMTEVLRKKRCKKHTERQRDKVPLNTFQHTSDPGDVITGHYYYLP